MDVFKERLEKKHTNSPNAPTVYLGQQNAY